MKLKNIKKNLEVYGVAVFPCTEEKAFDLCLQLAFNDSDARFYFKHRKNFALVLKFENIQKN